MSIDLEDQIRAMMHARIGHPSLTPGTIARAKARAGRRRVHQRAVAAVAVTGAAAVVGAGTLTGWPSLFDSGVAEPNPSASLPGSPFPLPTQQDNRIQMDATMAGVVVRPTANCLAVAVSPDQLVTNVEWPAGWTAREIDGTVVLYDRHGNEQAREGDRIRMGGGGAPDGTEPGCAEGPTWIASDHIVQEPLVDRSAQPADPSDGTEPGPVHYDMNEVSAQYERLQAVGLDFPDAAGSVVLDEQNRWLVVRVVDTSSGADGYRAAIDDAAQIDDVFPVVFAETFVTVAQLDSLYRSHAWAGPYADDVAQVIPNYLDETVSIYARDHLDELAAKALAHSGVRPKMLDVDDGIVIQQ